MSISILRLPTELPVGALALAWPTRRPIYPYTAVELASGVDVYTRALKRSGVRSGGS